MKMLLRQWTTSVILMYRCTLFFLKKTKKHVVEIFSTLKGTVFYIEMDILLFFAN